MCRVCLGRSVRHSRVIMTCLNPQSAGFKGSVCAQPGVRLSLCSLSSAGLHCGAQGANRNQNLWAEREIKHLGKERNKPWGKESHLERPRELLGSSGAAGSVPWLRWEVVAWLLSEPENPPHSFLPLLGFNLQGRGSFIPALSCPGLQVFSLWAV